MVEQTIHIRGREVRLLKEHLREAERGWSLLFGGQLRLDIVAVERQICALLDEGRYPLEGSSYVRLQVTADGSWSCSVEGESLYRGYVLRALRPDAVTIRFAHPFEGIQTTAARAVWQTARAMAEARKVRSVVRLDDEMTLREADGAPLFAVAGRTVYTSQEPQGVEGGLAREAIRRAGYPLEILKLKRDHLPRIEELFYVDFRGVTALKSCDGKLLLSAVAERVARQMESIFTKI